MGANNYMAKKVIALAGGILSVVFIVFFLLSLYGFFSSIGDASREPEDLILYAIFAITNAFIGVTISLAATNLFLRSSGNFWLQKLVDISLLVSLFILFGLSIIGFMDIRPSSYELRYCIIPAIIVLVLAISHKQI